MLATPDMDTEGKWSHLDSNERETGETGEGRAEMACCNCDQRSV